MQEVCERNGGASGFFLLEEARKTGGAGKARRAPGEGDGMGRPGLCEGLDPNAGEAKTKLWDNLRSASFAPQHAPELWVRAGHRLGTGTVTYLEAGPQAGSLSSCWAGT